MLGQSSSVELSTNRHESPPTTPMEREAECNTEIATHG